MKTLITLFLFQIRLSELILKKINRIYSHLELDWDNIDDNCLEDRYTSMSKLLEALEEQDKRDISSYPKYT
jgi:hypothetical protein